uniref:Uncharacterized protein n=1 Tax=Bombyx mori TaxID=7091 RepID=A0A8R2M3P1_BOMMO|nr:uncharacterized protein LOC119629771 [Bombyx mori]
MMSKTVIFTLTILIGISSSLQYTSNGCVTQRIEATPSPFTSQLFSCRNLPCADSARAQSTRATNRAKLNDLAHVLKLSAIQNLMIAANVCKSTKDGLWADDNRLQYQDAIVSSLNCEYPKIVKIYK